MCGLSLFVVAQKTKNATIYYTDKTIDNQIVIIRKHNFYSSIKIISDNINSNKSYKIFPKEVVKIETPDKIYYSLHFDDANYGIESYSFAEKIAGKTIVLVRTKFLEKTCNCQKYGAIERGYFLLTENNNVIRIRTDVRNYILNLREINSKLEEYGYPKLADKVVNIKTLAEFIATK